METSKGSARRFCHLRSMASVNAKPFYSSPSPRILQLARPREPKTIWLTTPVNVTWGNQETIWPPSRTLLKPRSMSRILTLSQPKKDFSALRPDLLRKENKDLEEADRKRKCLSSAKTQYEHVSCLANPKLRHGSSWVRSPAHTQRCEHSCPVWHISSAVQNAVASPRILQLAQPRGIHHEYKSNRQPVEIHISFAAKSFQTSPTLEQLGAPKLRESKLFYEHGPPESPIRPVSKAARTARASARVKELSVPKAYIPP